jgi:diguanylate cyclase (GGDEF)-like protein
MVDWSRGDLVERVLDRLPIGLSVRDALTRDVVYINEAAQVTEPAQAGGIEASKGAPILDRHTHNIKVDGKTYEVVTSVDVTDYSRRESELTKRAFFDDLTGLPKRDLFERTVNNMIAEGCAPFAISFIDVDNFKYVNDYYGHAIGDQLLKKIARRISGSIRPTDLLARVGGDEFVLLSTPIDRFDEPAAEIEHVARRFREPFFIDGYEIFSSASIGVSIYPLHGRDYNVVRANADSAMYRVKGSTKGAVGLFDSSLGHAATERMESEQRLRFAIRDRRLGCAFQPKVDFRTQEIFGVEVLLRWLDENGDVRAPGDLIKVAIELGLMDDIAFIVLDQVTSQIDLINDAFGPNASISLNIAAKQATDRGFMSKFADALKVTGYADRFILELTEEAFLSKGEFQLVVLPMLRELGIRVSIDDFGVGYSSLSALAEITADELKVDRSFITDIHKKPRNQSILKVIELLGQSLGIQVIVEGVETFEELAYLTAATRISRGQGYYFSKPIVLQPSSRPSTGYAERRDGFSSRDANLARGRVGRGRN